MAGNDCCYICRLCLSSRAARVGHADLLRVVGHAGCTGTVEGEDDGLVSWGESILLFWHVVPRHKCVLDLWS